MYEDSVFQQFCYWRDRTLNSISNIDPEFIDIVPVGFNNNIRWNLGHVLVTWDEGIYHSLSMKRMLPKDYDSFFKRGTKPLDWETQPPSFNEIRERLESQTEQIINACRGKLDLPLKFDFLGMKTIGEMFLFLITHESMHVGVLTSIYKSMKMIF